MLLNKIEILLCVCFMTFFPIHTSASVDTLTQRDTTVIVEEDTTVHQDTANTDFSGKEAIANDFANRLKSQLNLAEDQTDEAESIITSYIDNYLAGETDTSEWNRRIEIILNDAQIASWNSVRDGFWKDLKERLQE